MLASNNSYNQANSDDLIIQEILNNDSNANNNSNIDQSKNFDANKLSKMKEIIYKTYSNTIDHSIKNMKREKKEMKKLMDLLIYLQTKKIELKLNYFKDLEKILVSEKKIVRNSESELISEKLQLSIKKLELDCITKEISEVLKNISEGNNNDNYNKDCEGDNIKNKNVIDKVYNEGYNKHITNLVNESVENKNGEYSDIMQLD